MPYQERSYNNAISQPRLGNMTQFGGPRTNFYDGQMGYEVKHIHRTRYIIQNTYSPNVEAVGINTHTQDHKHMQTVLLNLSKK